MLTSAVPQDLARREAQASELLRSAIIEASDRFSLSRRHVAILLGNLVSERD